MRTLRLAALTLLLAAASACAASTGGSCQVDHDCANDNCCLTCGVGPCASGGGICCLGTCDSATPCPSGSTCDGGICL